MTLDYVRPTQYSVMQIIHCNVGLKCFFSFLPKCSFVIIVMYAYFIDISQSSVETHLRCGEDMIPQSRYCKLSAECNSERIVKIGQ